MAVTITASKLTARDTVETVTSNAATSTTANETETFTYTPTRASNRIVFIASAAASQGTVTLSIPAGDLWAAGNELSLSVEQGTEKVFELDGAKYKKANGTFSITAKPATGKKLATDHAFAIKVIEMPF